MARRFGGYHQITLDGKGRLALPTRFREDMGLCVALQMREQGCLVVYPQPVWNEEAQRLYDRSLTDPEAERDYRFRNHRTTEDVSVDGSGRVQIPADVREKVALEGQLVLVGAGDRLELWRSDAYAAFERREEARMGYNLSGGEA